MGANEKKIGWAQALRLSMKGYKIIHKLEPQFMPLDAIDNIILAIAPLVNLYMSALILNRLAAGIENLSQVLSYVAMAIAFNFAFAGIRSLTQKKLTAIRAVLQRKYYIFLSNHYMELDFEQIEKTEVTMTVADIKANTMATGSGIMQLTRQFGLVIQQVVGIAGALVILSGMFVMEVSAANNFIASHWATAILAILFVALPLFSLYRQKYVQKALDVINAEGPRANNLFGYYYTYIRAGEAAKDIRIFGQQPAILDIVKKRSNIRIWHRFSHAMGREGGIAVFANGILAGAAYLLIGLRALWGMYAIGSVVAYVGAASNLSGSISGLVSNIMRIKANAEFLPKVFGYLDLPKAKHSGTLPLKTCEHEIEFHNVSFKYPGTEKYALRDLSFKFHMGQKLAIVGQNGSGKTTMIKLLSRLYEPTEGYITLDGVDIREYLYEDYLSLFSVVFQDYKLFGFTLGQNLACDEKYDSAIGEKSLANAGFEAPPSVTQGLDTPLLKDLHKDGINLSGGESQKVAIARALYKDAPFVLLDEPTAALDPEAEFDVYFRLNKISGAKSVVYISHRLASCRFCNDIIVFHEGRLVQNGAHEALLADKNGKYCELWNAQAKYYGESANASDADSDG